MESTKVSSDVIDEMCDKFHIDKDRHVGYLDRANLCYQRMLATPVDGLTLDYTDMQTHKVKYREYREKLSKWSDKLQERLTYLTILEDGKNNNKSVKRYLRAIGKVKKYAVLVSNTEADVCSALLHKAIAKPKGDKKKLSGYLAFIRARRAGLKAEQPDLTFGETNTALGVEWRAMTESAKAKYK